MLLQLMRLLLGTVLATAAAFDGARRCREAACCS